MITFYPKRLRLVVEALAGLIVAALAFFFIVRIYQDPSISIMKQIFAVSVLGFLGFLFFAFALSAGYWILSGQPSLILEPGCVRVRNAFGRWHKIAWSEIVSLSVAVEDESDSDSINRVWKRYLYFRQKSELNPARKPVLAISEDRIRESFETALRKILTHPEAARLADESVRSRRFSA